MHGHMHGFLISRGAHMNGQINRSIVSAQTERAPVGFEGQRTGHKGSQRRPPGEGFKEFPLQALQTRL